MVKLCAFLRFSTLSSVSSRSSAGSVAMASWPPNPASGNSAGPPEAPATSSAGVVRGSPAPSVGAALGVSTCFSPLAPTSTCQSSGGGRSGSVAFVPGAGSTGADPSGAEASGADAAATGPALDDSSWVGDPGAGEVEAGVSWRSAPLAALMKSKLVNTQVERSNHLLYNQRQTHSTDFFLMALFIRTA
jgi:hypothetical protein